MRIVEGSAPGARLKSYSSSPAFAVINHVDARIHVGSPQAAQRRRRSGTWRRENNWWAPASARKLPSSTTLNRRSSLRTPAASILPEDAESTAGTSKRQRITRAARGPASLGVLLEAQGQGTKQRRSHRSWSIATLAERWASAVFRARVRPMPAWRHTNKVRSNPRQSAWRV